MAQMSIMVYSVSLFYILSNKIARHMSIAGQLLLSSPFHHVEFKHSLNIWTNTDYFRLHTNILVIIGQAQFFKIKKQPKKESVSIKYLPNSYFLNESLSVICLPSLRTGTTT